LGSSVAPPRWPVALRVDLRRRHTLGLSRGGHAPVSRQYAEYHQALLSASRNRRLLAIAESLRESAELYRRWSVPLELEERDIAGEHRGILRALLDHDADTAAELLTAHIQRTTNVLLEQDKLVCSDPSAIS
jgi:DNA-binding GntR family transcriptional regulator